MAAQVIRRPLGIIERRLELGIIRVPGHRPFCAVSCCDGTLLRDA